MSVHAFWAFMAWVNSLTVPCVAVTQSTHGIPDTQYPIVYGGNCTQAFQLVLHTPGLAWQILTSSL